MNISDKSIAILDCFSGVVLNEVMALMLFLNGFFGRNSDSSGISPTPCNIDIEKHSSDENEYSDDSNAKSSDGYDTENNRYPYVRPPLVQKGVLRTNCIDCLDRTNVAQYAYGLAALGHQLCALGVTTSTNLDLSDPLAEELMDYYERMGDVLAHQYGGSAAHNKVANVILCFQFAYI